jgi:hypothetical protein
LCSNYIFCSLPEIFTTTSINEQLQIFTHFKGKKNGLQIHCRHAGRYSISLVLQMFQV